MLPGRADGAGHGHSVRHVEAPGECGRPGTLPGLAGGPSGLWWQPPFERGQAGLLAAILGVLAHFTVTLTTILHLHHYTLAGAADAAAYAHSGYPSVASYVLSDTLSGSILGGLIMAPVVLLGVAFLGARAGTGLRELAARRAAP